MNILIFCVALFLSCVVEGKINDDDVPFELARDFDDVELRRDSREEKGPCAKALETSGPHLIGAYRPQCDKDGNYELTQCHGSIGYCWCVTKDGHQLTSKQRPWLNQLNCEVAPCQQEISKLSSLMPAILVRGTPQLLGGKILPDCTKDGYFKPLQCNTKDCWCVDKLGAKVANSKMVSVEKKAVLKC